MSFDCPKPDNKPDENTFSSVYAVNIIRQRIEGLKSELYFSNYLVDRQRLPKPTEQECERLMRKIAADFLRTDEGRQAYEDTCEDFNWGDMETYIPNGFLNAYGVSRCHKPFLCCGIISFVVNQDEHLVDCSL